MESPAWWRRAGWHRHRHHAGPHGTGDTTNEEWGLLSGHNWGLRLGHQWGLFHGHGQGLYDWQVLCRGHWAIDVSYTLIVGLAIDDRRNWEQDLLQHYLKTLTDQAVPSVPTHAQAMHEYRKHPMHAYAFGVFTNGQPWYLPELQPSNYTRQSIERILVALEDLDTLNELRR